MQEVAGPASGWQELQERGTGQETAAAWHGRCSARSRGIARWGMRGSEPPAQPAPIGLWSLPHGQVGTQKAKQAHSLLAKDPNWRSGGDG